jgi:hypothetical protein
MSEKRRTEKLMEWAGQLARVQGNAVERLGA